MRVEDPWRWKNWPTLYPQSARLAADPDDPEEQVERIRPYVEMGFNHLVFHGPGPDQARFIKLYSEHVTLYFAKPSGNSLMLSGRLIIDAVPD